MLFNSLQFLLFFPSVLFVLFFLKNQKASLIFLLVASLYFYASWNFNYLFLILISIISTYISAIAIDQNTGKEREKKIILMFAIFLNLLILFFFKYYDFFRKELSSFNITSQFPEWKFLLPVGISFYTFQAIGYLIDVYRRSIPAEKNWINYSLFITFFPQLVAGPIEKAEHILVQFRNQIKWEKANLVNGFDLVLWGFLKKVVLADRLSVYVDSVYSNLEVHGGLTLLVASVLFSIQIYCDFSGYSDIAVGIARMMGFNLIQNFKNPYFSKNIGEFWSRWHISLTSWFRDYLYIPLGGNRVTIFRNYLNVLIVFLLSGLWHGANWTFVVWGLLHGLCRAFGMGFQKMTSHQTFFVKLSKSKFVDLINILLTFGFVTFAWIYFRANNLTEAHYIIGNILFKMELTNTSLRQTILPFTQSNVSIAHAIVVSFWVFFVFYIEKIKEVNFNFVLRLFISISILFFGKFDNVSFLYFQF
ncbi:MBOAT family O-acyltransferase [Leptospira ilyithenensis]|uniref:MBOAT family protein n=1 Tax=Leptospira ilyithenensis TaxID=2484901 RepID=A0A4R9LTH5_9LEPT|nr:MBOAT family O-acyltransferase [Leptospira ilyithenensis]TGN11998.1 MBOAT family protein [Leptospira ilyithenensis]